MKVLILIAALILTGCLARHDRTQAFPVCSITGVEIRAIESVSGNNDETIEIFVEGKRVATASLYDYDWVKLKQYLPEKMKFKSRKETNAAKDNEA